MQSRRRQSGRSQRGAVFGFDDIIRGVLDEAAQTGKNINDLVKEKTGETIGENIAGRVPWQMQDLAKHGAFFHGMKDTIREYDGDLADHLDKNESLMAQAQTGLNWTPPVDRKIRNMISDKSPTDIMTDRTLKLTDDQRKAAAITKRLQMDSDQAIQKSEEGHGYDLDPTFEAHLKAYQSELHSPPDIAPDRTATLSNAISMVGRQMVKSRFEKNLPFLGLQVTHGPLMIPGKGGFSAMAQAAHMMTTNPDVYKMIAGNPLVQDYRKDFSNEGFLNNKLTDLLKTGGEKVQQAVNKIAPDSALSRATEGIRNFSVPEHNLMWSGIANAIHEVGPEAVEKYAKWMNEGRPGVQTDEQTNVAQAIADGINEMTGEGTSQYGKSALQKDPRTAFAAPLTSFSAATVRQQMRPLKTLIDPKASPDMKKVAARSMANIMIARMLLGGTAVLPELQDPIESAVAWASPPAYLAWRSAARLMNLPRWANADISQHVNRGFGLMGPLIVPGVQSLLNAGEKKDLVKVTAKLLEMFGGPVGGITGRALETGEKAAQRQETTYVYPRSLWGGVRPIGMGTRKYDVGQAARSNLVMGRDANKANLDDKLNTIKTLENTGHDPAPYMGWINMIYGGAIPGTPSDYAVGSKTPPQ